jgi:hypothetical protein
MNLMFRKNFREGGSGGKSTGTKLNKMNRTGRKRDMSLQPSTSDDCHYRTHIFFNANRGAYQNNCEG